LTGTLSMQKSFITEHKTLYDQNSGLNGPKIISLKIKLEKKNTRIVATIKKMTDRNRCQRNSSI
jgi:hypothetical protein